MISEALIRRLATGAALFCVALVACTLVVAANPQLRTRLGFGPEVTTSYSAGEQIDVNAALYDHSPLTVLLFARSTCDVCRRAAPTFASMFEQARAHPRVRIRLISTGAAHDDEVSYAHTVGLNEDDMETIDVAPLRLQSVPTMVLVDRAGVVRFVAEGVPAAAQQDEFRRRLTIAGSER